MFKIKNKGLRNIFLFALIAALLGMLLSTRFIYPSFIKLLVKNTEEEAVQIAKHISQMIFHDVIDIQCLTQNMGDPVDQLHVLFRGHGPVFLGLTHLFAEFLG